MSGERVDDCVDGVRNKAVTAFLTKSVSVSGGCDSISVLHGPNGPRRL